MQKKTTITILVPCFNEEQTIERSAYSWLTQSVPPDQIIVVDDCSSDRTVAVLEAIAAKTNGPIEIIRLPKNTGNKSYAQEQGIPHITSDLFITTDADTLMDKFFLERVLRAFQDPKVAALAGYVKSQKHNWLTACREIDYLIGQDLHKVAQKNINFLFVIPGCAGAFRTDVFREHITFDHDTLTEDLDFTYKLNKRNLKIIYDRNAVVYTQDPDNLRSYINQLRRWQSGGWQNLMKHIDVVKHPLRALELSVVYIEGIVFYPIMLMMPLINIRLFLHMIEYIFMLTLLLGLFAAWKRKRFDLFYFSPAYALLSFVHAYIFLEQFTREVLLRRKNMIWYHPERRGMA